MDDNAGQIFGAGVTTLMQGGLNGLLAERNAEIQKDLYDYTAQQAYMYGEKSADRADIRTRLLYNDLYSPQAQIQQIKEAGLSPSLYYGDAGGISGQAGAQGTGAAGAQTNAFGINPIDLAQISALTAQANKSNAEARNVNVDTDIKELELFMNELQLGEYQNEWEVVNQCFTDAQGKPTSLFEIAEQCYTYDEFVKNVREHGGTTDSEKSQRVLRDIYTNASKLETDIAVLSNDKVSAKFQKAITEKLNEKGFIESNVNAAIQELKTMQATNELTETQKNAWNNLINKLGKKGSTMRDIVVVIGMILGNYAKNANIRINTGGVLINNQKGD